MKKQIIGLVIVYAILGDPGRQVASRSGDPNAWLRIPAGLALLFEACRAALVKGGSAMVQGRNRRALRTT